MRLIDADELLRKFCDGCPDNENGDNCIMNHCVDYDLVVTMPTIDAKPTKHGRWRIETENNVMYCDSCGKLFDCAGLEEIWNYCPNCGAKNDERG